jgi:hypothetical protein
MTATITHPKREQRDFVRSDQKSAIATHPHITTSHAKC